MRTGNEQHDFRHVTSVQRSAGGLRLARDLDFLQAGLPAWSDIKGARYKVLSAATENPIQGSMGKQY